MTVPSLTIDANGITVPAFADILDGLVAEYQAIYGADVFLDPSSQDFQWISIIATAISDCYKACAATFNSFSPTNAQSVGLSSLVKINGLNRQAGRFSTVDVTLGGVSNTTIINGMVGDDQNLNTQWLLPTPVVIPASGSTIVTAICSQSGAITAAPGSITRILNPQPGWQTVTNISSAAPGAATESDSQLKERQASSTSLPAQTPVESLQAAIENVTGVTLALVYENKTNLPDANGIPAFNLAAVVDGGAAPDIATTIALKKTPGAPTFGTIGTQVIDKRGIPSTIFFSPLVSVPLTVVITIKALSGFGPSIGTEIVDDVVSFINDNLGIGDDSFLARLYTPANLGGSGDGATFVVTSIIQARDANIPAANDVAAAYNEAFFTDDTRVTLVVQ